MTPPTLTDAQRAQALGDPLPDAEIVRRLEDAELALADVFRTRPGLRMRAITGGTCCREIREELSIYGAGR
jgi:hypothetical protein